MFFFFQAEDGIRDYKVTGVQTCALPILIIPASTRTVTQCVMRTIQWWRRTRGRGGCGSVMKRSGRHARYGRICSRVRGDERILTNVQRLPTPARSHLACSAMTHPEPSGPAVPARINGLASVAANLSWSWNRNARALFRMLDVALWRRTQHNPIELLRRVDPARLPACAADAAFLRLSAA